MSHLREFLGVTGPRKNLTCNWTLS